MGNAKLYGEFEFELRIRMHCIVSWMIRNDWDLGSEFSFDNVRFDGFEELIIYLQLAFMVAENK